MSPAAADDGADVEVAVVGGGAVGVTTAHDLAVRGASVTLYEQGSVADGASGRAAGVCYDAYPGRTDARLAERALERFRSLSGDGFAFEPRPYVWWARADDDRRADAIRAGVDRMRDHDRDVSLVDRDTLCAEFPALAPDDLAVAAIARNAGHTDPAGYTRAMADRAVVEGVDLREGTPATLDGPAPTVLVDGEREPFDACVVAAGAHTRQVAAPAVDLPVKPYRVQALTTEPHPMRAALPMAYDATAGVYLRPHEDGGLLVGDGTEPVERDPDDWDRAADDWFVADATAHLCETVGRELPVARSWAGLCTATPDGDPLLGAVAPGLFVATGWQGHGFMRAPAVGERLAMAVLGERDLPERFAPDRFADDDVADFPVVEGMDVEGRLAE